MLWLEPSPLCLLVGRRRNKWPERHGYPFRAHTRTYGPVALIERWLRKFKSMMKGKVVSRSEMNKDARVST
eukprot:753858-Hanusia_phi.AAC.3